MNLTDLPYLLPELILLLAAAAVFALAALWPKAWLPYVALVGLAAAALGLIPSLGRSPQRAAAMLAADPFAIFFKALAIIGVAVVILMAIPYLNGHAGEGEPQVAHTGHKGMSLQARTPYRGEFYALLLIVALAICLAVSATNLVMLYLAMEFLSITSYVLAGFLRQDRKSGEAALKYFLYGATASAVMLYGISLLYGATGTTDLASVAASLMDKARGESVNGLRPLAWLGMPAMVLLLAGFGFKASLVPFHQWAPDTYEGAPTPVTAFLSTASKAAGFAILMRVFLVALAPLSDRWVALLVAMSVLTMTVGNLTALRQTNVKRLLAYSSIAQAGYILIGVAAVLLEGGGAGASPAPTTFNVVLLEGGRAGASPAPTTFNGINGVLIYLFAYLFTNVGAFAVVTAVETATGKVELQDYAGLIRRAPWLAALLLIFLLSLAGIPPTGGFLGKFFVFGAAVRQQMWGLLAIAAVNTVVAAFYYLNIVRYMFFAPAEKDARPVLSEDEGPVKVDLSLQAALAITAVLTLLLGLIPGPLIAWAAQSVRMLALK